MPTRLAVLGFPIAHSLSPSIHRAAYRQLGVPWHYSAVRCGEAGLARFIAGRGPEWLGCSVTMPLKVEAHRIADALDPVAVESGVANTLVRREDGGWFGANTDVAGLAAAIRRAGLDATDTVVIGSGATAVSAVLAARSLGAARISLLARNAVAARDLAERFGGTASAAGAGPVDIDYAGDGSRELPLSRTPTLVISTLPGPAAARVELPTSLLGVPLFDVAYDPWPSPLAERWRRSGGQSWPGTDMLVEQALLQVRLFTHGDATVPLPDEGAVAAAMRAAV